MGIINKNDLLNDLCNWKNFYMAGRFQKQMLTIKSDDEIDKAILENRKNAIVTSLLMINNQKATLYDLLKTICSLSYLGDVRMGIAENPHKIDNLVKGGYEEFKEMYKNDDLYILDQNGHVIINYDNLLASIESLPTSLRKYLDNNAFSKEDLINIKNLIVTYFQEMNKGITTAQTLKGILTTGPINSALYVGEKIKKRLKK